MTPIKRIISYVFLRDNLRLRLRWAGREVVISTGHKVDRTSETGKPKWDGRRCMAATRHGKAKTPASIINHTLIGLENRIEEIFLEFELADRIPDREDVTSRMRSQTGNPDTVSPRTFRQLYLEFITSEGAARDWAYNTVRSARQVGNLVLKFSPRVRIGDITPEWLRRFVNWQKSHRLSDKNFASGAPGYANNVIAKNCRILKWFLKWASARGHISNNTVEDFSPTVKTIRKPVIYLTWEELMKFWNAELPEGSPLDRARDIFCFCCFTSLRYSDAVALRKSQVMPDTIHVTTVKTATTLEIDLNKFSRAILEKYRDSDSTLALPYLTNYRLNYYLKQLGRDLGLTMPITLSQYYGANRIDRSEPKWKLLSSHCARRTFICHALSLGIAPNVVMKWTGHAEYSAMRPYIDIAETIRRDSMRLFDQL